MNWQKQLSIFINFKQMTVLELKSISKSFGEVKLFNDLNLTIEQGQTVGLFGPSGCGKSTLLYISCGILSPDFGEVFVMGKPLNSEESILKARRENFGFIFQAHNLIPELTGIENILVPQEISKKKDAEFAKFLMQELGIFERRNEKPATLSGGEAQRFAIARAFATKPSIVFADEPTGNLDPETAEKTINLITSLAKEFNTSVLMVTHNYSFKKKFNFTLDICK